MTGNSDPNDRRNFLKQSTALAAAGVAGGASKASSKEPKSVRKSFTADEATTLPPISGEAVDCGGESQLDTTPHNE
jgi:hypothetical protein